MIRYLKQEEKGKSRKLWEDVFSEDSRSFVDYYYTEKIKRNRILAAEEGERLIAMLHRNPYDVVVKDRVWKADYIVGVATDALWRHQGYMRRLLMRCLSDMYMEGMEFCFLVPADPAIYLPFDFAYIFDRCKEEPNASVLTVLGARACTERAEDCREAARFAARQLEKEYEVYTVRDEEYYRNLCREVRSDSGDLLFLRTKDDQERLVGLSAYYGDAEPTSRELICLPEYRKVMGSKTPAVMARIVSLGRFVKVIRLKEDSAVDEMELMIEVEDSQISQNHGVFCWRLTKKGSELVRARGDGVIRPHLSLTIGEMTAWLFGYSQPAVAEDRRAMADQIETLSGVYFDEVV